jgi:hypothetical protein
LNLPVATGKRFAVPKPNHSHLAITHAAGETLAVFSYGDVDIRVSFPTPEGVDGLDGSALVRKLSPQLRRALSVALEDLG